MNTLSRNEWIAVTIGIVITLGILGGLSFLPQSQLTQQLNQPYSMSSSTNTNSASTSPEEIIVSEDVRAQIIKEGTGEPVKNGNTVSVHYTGRLEDGTIFDSSEGRDPLSFTVGGGQMIPGFDAATLGMKKGEMRRMTLSPAAAYGARGVNNPQTGEVIIPANATLTFDVELVDFR